MTEPAATSQPTATPDASSSGRSRFVWYDLMTTDVYGSFTFYGALFGWQRQPWDMGEGGTYDMIQAGEESIGGVMRLNGADGIPSHWIGYLSVADVDAACAATEAAGGTTCVPPTDIPTIGRFAVVEDPAGAIYSPFRGSGEGMPQAANAPIGTFAWNELMTSDPEQAAAYYTGLTGWDVERMDMGPLGIYWLFRSAGAPAAGMMQLPADAQARPHWLSYVAIADCDASAARVAELGGTVMVPPTDIEDWGRFAVASDPAGAVFGMLQNKRPM
jgi:predicted enzyme related to lactoylglutathione lyase